MSDQLTKEQTQEIVDSLAAGRQLEAIKLYRVTTGKGLKEAKDFIDALIPRLIEQDPEKYGALARRGAGCTSAMIVLTLGGAVALLLAIA